MKRNSDHRHTLGTFVRLNAAHSRHLDFLALVVHIHVATVQYFFQVSKEIAI